MSLPPPQGPAAPPGHASPPRPAPRARGPCEAAAWIVDLALSPERLARCDAVLDPAERARAARFQRPEDRDRHRASHAALRLALADALGVAPAEVRFTAGPAGKPALAGAGPRFNLSHSGGLGLIGLCPEAEVGVDVEVLRPLPDALRIAGSQFAADEAAALAALPPGSVQAAFFGLWTRKEAVVKALGTGLSLPLARFGLSVPPAPPRVLRPPDGAGAWTLADVEAGPGAAAALAVQAAGARVAARRLPPDWPDRL